MAKTYRIGIIGAGTMGAGIAQKMAQEGLEVSLLDISQEKVERGLAGIKDTLDQGVERRVFSREKADAALNRIKGTTSYEDMKGKDLVVEAVFEDKKLKADVFQKLDEICDPETILATNTSALSVADLAQSVKRKDKFLGMHYFFHPAKNRLLEIITHDGTSQETLEEAVFIAKIHGKTTIVLKDTPGFIVNRFFIPYYVQSIRCLEEGLANIPTIEKAAKDALGIGMGPFELINVSGMGVSADAPESLVTARGTFYTPPQILKDKAAYNELWDLESGEVQEDKIPEVRDLIFGAVFGVVGKMVDEGISRIEQIDRGAKVGLRWKEGPFELINKLGIDKAYECVQKVEARYPHLEFEMPETLKKHHQSKEPFHFTFVETETVDGIAYLTINRPEAMNALNDAVFNQLIEEFGRAEKDEKVRAVVIRSTGKEFGAGADIKYFVTNIKNNDIEKTVKFTRMSLDFLRSLETSSKLTVALLDGMSLGAGSELALSCQAIVATPEGSLGFPETGIGIFPGNAGMIRLERHLGPELAKYYVFTGKTITAAEAKKLGIVQKLVDITEVDKAIKEVIREGQFDKYADREIPAEYNQIRKAFSEENARKLIDGKVPEGVEKEFGEKMVGILSRKAPIALRTANMVIDKQKGVSIDEATEIELKHNAEIMKTEDALLGLTNVGKKVQFLGK